MAGNKELITAIYNKRLEIHYNQWYIRDKDNKPLKLELKGKIRCPLLNTTISTLACSKLMDKPGWPRAIDNTACKKCDCYVYLSIFKFKERKEKLNGTTNAPSSSTKQS